MCPSCREQDESHNHFIFYCKLSKITLDYISELINPNYYTFNIPLKVSPKAMIMGASSQSHDDIHLKVLSTLLEVFLKDLS